MTPKEELILEVLESDPDCVERISDSLAASDIRAASFIRILIAVYASQRLTGTGARKMACLLRLFLPRCPGYDDVKVTAGAMLECLRVQYPKDCNVAIEAIEDVLET